ncbi:MAG: zinc ABC transporter substrate-binding protein [Clostridia bacterium]|nr:zinc ABC transporter substrate-binding protein [Clostridia bacterium]
MNKKTIRYILFITIILLFSFLFNACSNLKSSNDKIKIVASLFPQYDFAKQIAEDRAEVTLLLPPGTESHSFDPSTSDIVNTSKADIFLYTGKYMEPWAERLISGIDSKSLLIKDLSENISLIKNEEADDHSEDEHEHDHSYDPHFWLDPTLASLMVDNILEALCEKDPDGYAFYENNARKLKDNLKKLDEDFFEIIETSKRHTVVFAGKFAHLYFIKRYNLDYKAVLKNCSAQTEPSIQKLTEIINFVKNNDIPAVYYEESTVPPIAQSICENTNAKALRFNTLHNVSKEQLESNVTYFDLMNENLENLKMGLTL